MQKLKNEKETLEKVKANKNDSHESESDTYERKNDICEVYPDIGTFATKSKGACQMKLHTNYPHGLCSRFPFQLCKHCH